MDGLTKGTTSASAGFTINSAEIILNVDNCALIIKEVDAEKSSYKIIAQKNIGTKINVDDREHSLASGSFFLQTHIKLKTKY